MRRRSLVEVAKAKDFGIQKFSKDMIQIADVLELAISQAPKDEIMSGDNTFAKGMFEGMERCVHLSWSATSSS